MRLGFIGTGALTSAIVTGLKSVNDGNESILVSPRNAGNAKRLAENFPDVAVAADNQAVLDGTDVVMLAVRPQDAAEVLASLRFRPDHHVISLMATITLDEVAQLVAPATEISKALPMPMVAQRVAPTIICPPDPVSEGIFGRLGKAIVVDNEDAFNALSVVTATFATYFSYLEMLSDWVAEQGVPETQAREYVAGIYQALTLAAQADPANGFSELAQDYKTAGGINEQMVTELAAKGLFGVIAESLENVHKRLAGAKRA